MHLLNFTLSAEAVVRVHDIVLCLSKFSEVVSFEGVADKVGPSLRCVNIEYLIAKMDGDTSSFSVH